MRIIFALLIILLAGPAIGQESDNPRGWPIPIKLNSQDRAIVLQGLSLLEKECPGLKEFEWASKRKQFAPVVEFTSNWAEEAPWEPAIEGWLQSIYLSFDLHGPTIAISMGWGKNSGIAVRTAGGYGGEHFCGLNEKRGEYTYRRVPAFDVFIK